jgi:hypothetical protein
VLLYADASHESQRVVPLAASAGKPNCQVPTAMRFVCGRIFRSDRLTRRHAPDGGLWFAPHLARAVGSTGRWGHASIAALSCLLQNALTSTVDVICGGDLAPSLHSLPRRHCGCQQNLRTCIPACVDNCKAPHQALLGIPLGQSIRLSIALFRGACIILCSETCG